MLDNEIFFACKPVHHVHTQVHVAAVAGVTIGEERAVADDHDALFPVIDVALQCYRDDYGAAGVMLFVEVRLALRRFAADPSPRRDFHELAKQAYKLA